MASASNGTNNITYTYDANGLRHTKTVDGIVYTYYYAGDKLVRETFGSTVIDFFYDPDGRPYAMKYNGLVLYYVLNQQGDVVRLIDSEGVNYGSYKYDAWGNILQMPSTNYIKNNPLRYRGYVYDPETELYYCQSRYYDPKIGRFLNADALVSTGQGILGNNMYAYCNNNPVNLTDYSGKSATIAGGIIGGFWGLISALTDEEDEDDKETELEDIFMCILLGAAAGAAAGFVADISVASFGVGSIAVGLSALAGGGAGLVNSAGSQYILDESVDWGKVVYDGLWGALMGGTCTAMGSNTTTPLRSWKQSYEFVNAMTSAEMYMALTQGYVGTSLWFDVGATAVTSFGSWLGGIAYGYHKKLYEMRIN